MEPIGGDVRRELGRFGPQAGMPELVAAWADAVGESIARNAWPARIARDGTLHVAASSSAWAFELAQLQATVLERLRAALGDDAPKSVKFAPGPLPTDDADTAARDAPRPGPQQLAVAAELASPIEDEKLRESVEKAAALSLARAAADRSF